jgi:hypothetical protein
LTLITVPEVMAQTLGTFLAAETRGRFGASHAELVDLLPFAAKLTLECIGNSDALYHNIEHSMLVTLVGHDILIGRRIVAAGGLIAHRCCRLPIGVDIAGAPPPSRLRPGLPAARDSTYRGNSPPPLGAHFD